MVLKNKPNFEKIKSSFVSIDTAKIPYVSKRLPTNNTNNAAIATFLITDLFVVKMPLNIITTPHKADKIIAFIK